MTMKILNVFAIIILMACVQEYEMAPYAVIVTTKCSDLDRPLPGNENLKIRNIIQKILTGVVKLSRGNTLKCDIKFKCQTFNNKGFGTKTSKNSDYELIVLIRAFYNELKPLVKETMTKLYVTGNAQRKRRVEEVEGLMCDLHMELDQVIESYEVNCETHQTKPTIVMSSFFHVFDLDLKTMPDCMQDDKENTVENQVKLLFVQAERMAQLLVNILKLRNTLHLKYVNNNRRVIG